MLSATVVRDAISRMSLLPFFPSEDAWPSLAELINDMCSNDSEVEWVSRRAIQQWGKWEGPRELRALFCCRFKPRDGDEVYSQLPQFSEGYPSERPQIEAPIPKRLTAGETTEDPESEQLIADLSRKISMDQAQARQRHLSLKEAETSMERGPRKSAEQIQNEVRALELALGRTPVIRQQEAEPTA